MGRKLATDVHVIGSKGPFDFVVLEAGSEVPDEYADQVTAESAYLPDAEPDTVEVDAPDADAPTGWAALTVAQLKAELEQRDLPHSGSKAELVARLVEDDAERAKESGTDSDANPANGEGPDPESETPAS